MMTIELVETLLTYHANPNYLHCDALVSGVRQNNVLMVELLLTHGSDRYWDAMDH